MAPLKKTRRSLAFVLVAAGVLSFFLPLASINLPIVGHLQWSALDVVTQVASAERADAKTPSFRDISELGKSRSAEQPTTSTGGDTSKSDEPLGITLAPFIPVEIAIAYVLLCLIAVALLLPPMQDAFGWLAGLGTVIASVALVSMFLFASAVKQSFADTLNTPEMRDNPFAALGQVLANSVRIEPGSAVYLLVCAMAGLLIVSRLTWLDRLEVRNEGTDNRLTVGE